MTRPRLVAFSGNVRRPSRTRGLVEALAARTAARTPVDLKVYDILDLGPGFGAALARADLPLPAARILDAIEGADALIVGSPVYKGAYAGLFKHLFDFVEPDRLAAKPVALAATGGGQRHALVVEHALRPLFGFFAALTVPTAVYAGDADLAAGEDGAYRLTEPAVTARLDAAADELASLLLRAVPRPVLAGRSAGAQALRSPDR